MAAKETTPHVEAPIYGVGDRLKEAREGKKYSQAEVAVQLRLNKDIIVALESHDWDALHGRTYARGYFANYVRFLGLPFDEMLALFNLEYAGTPSDINLKHVSEKPTTSGTPWFVVVLLMAIVPAGAAYYFYYMPQSDANPESNIILEPTLDNQFDDSVVEPLTQPLEVDETVSMTMPIDELPAALQLMAPAEASEDLAEQTAEQEILVSYGEASDEVIETVAIIEGNNTQTATPTLTLSVSEACWVEVTSAQEVLISRVLKPDETVSFDVQMPLSLLIGKAGVTTVIYDDNPIDLSPYTEGDVARLTVGTDF